MDQALCMLVNIFILFRRGYLILFMKKSNYISITPSSRSIIKIGLFHTLKISWLPVWHVSFRFLTVFNCCKFEDHDVDGSGFFFNEHLKGSSVWSKKMFINILLMDGYRWIHKLLHLSESLSPLKKNEKIAFSCM